MLSRRFSRFRFPTIGLLPALWIGAQLQLAAAAPQKVAEFNEKGNFLLIGNTVGWDCAAGVPTPVVGNVAATADCGMNLDDSSGDVMWSTDGTSATAQSTTTPLKAGSLAVLNVPADAVVVNARLFWSAQLPAGSSAGGQVTLDRPGTFSTLIGNDPSFPGLTVQNSGRTYYQGNADITKLVQKNGSGAYRVTGIPTSPLLGLLENVAFVNWHMVVVYRKADEPTRNLVVYRGMDPVTVAAPADATLDGFLVPPAGFAGQLGIIGYEGDDLLNGDSFLFNNVVQSNALNPATNFFNSTRSNLGSAVTVAGDLPQMSGAVGSMIGLDLDVIDVTPQLTAGATSATVRASSNGDLYFLGGFVTGISTLFPVFSDSTKTYVNVSRPDQPVVPGDTVRYTMKVLNNGSDTSINTILSDPLPPQLTYVPGTIKIIDGPNAGAQTDQPGDDQVDYDANTRTITVRVGTGATAVLGGTVPVGETTTIELLAQVSRAISGRLDNQGVVTAQGQKAFAQNVKRAGTWLTGDGTAPNIPTSITVDCSSDVQCTPLAPKCDRSLTPARCACTATADCPTGYVCDPTARSCVQCTAAPAQTQSCQASGLGAVCLPDNRCGCNSDADCGGRVCDLGTRTCPHPNSDLDVRVIPPAGPVMPGTTAIYSVQITDLGPDPVTNANIYTQLPPGITGASWTCMAVGAGATCPAPSGQGALPPTVTLPNGGKLIYTLSIPIPANYPSESVPVKVTALPAPGATDPQPNNNTGVGDAVVPHDSRPDLYLDVKGDVGGEPLTNVYTVTANNRGPASAPGAYFTYTAPEGSEVISTTPGEGWTCKLSTDKRTLSCETQTPIAAQGSAPPVVFIVKSPAGVRNQPFVGTISPTDGNGLTLTDGKPEDNLSKADFPLPDVMLAGGGFGCSVGPGSVSNFAPLAGLAGFLVMLTGRNRRRRKAS
ncbi:MAG TPA: MYXO-CTERM sorting domain-containing protein [Pseudomonadota bacterium]|nr:MYXO-CTERM sorting domain-containing protein [Pseudomonadota bacterium]